jgi:hypothetical protein
MPWSSSGLIRRGGPRRQRFRSRCNLPFTRDALQFGFQRPCLRVIEALDQLLVPADRAELRGRRHQRVDDRLGLFLGEPCRVPHSAQLQAARSGDRPCRPVRSCESDRFMIAARRSRFITSRLPRALSMLGQRAPSVSGIALGASGTLRTGRSSRTTGTTSGISRTSRTSRTGRGATRSGRPLMRPGVSQLGNSCSRRGSRRPVRRVRRRCRRTQPGALAA